MQFIVLLFSLIISTQAYSQQKVVAEVNGKKIYYKELVDYYVQSLKIVSTRKITLKSALQELINRELGLQKAKKEKINNDPIVKKKIEDIMYHAQISKDLEGKLAKIRVSDAEVKDYYKKNKEYRTAHILYRLNVTPTQEETQTAYTKAYEAYLQVKDNPKKFSKVATEQNQSAAAAFGGDIGFQPPTALAPEYYEAINGKKPGFISEPVRTQYGFHVIHIIDVRDFDEIQVNVYKKIIYDQKRDKIIADYFKGLEKKAEVSINKQNLKQ